MKVIVSSALLVIATILLTFFGVAASMKFPVSGNPRDVLIMAAGAAGIVVAILAVRELRLINTKLNSA